MYQLVEEEEVMGEEEEAQEKGARAKNMTAAVVFASGKFKKKEKKHSPLFSNQMRKHRSVLSLLSY